ncbi:MAG: hypothetical protein ABSH56_20700 [Bryobacteraceae bacterium]
MSLCFWYLQAGTVVMDRIAVIVGKEAIKSSDIDRDLRVTEFLNGEPIDRSPSARRKAAERLIDQFIIRHEIEEGGYARVRASEVDTMLVKVRQERFGGSQARLIQELSRYGLSEDQLQMELRWQEDALGFIDQRFRPGVFVTDEEVRSYYEAHSAELKRQFPRLQTYTAMEPKIRESLEGERLNQSFEQWLTAERKRNCIVYREGAFQ